MSSTPTVKVIKSDAQIAITFGVPFIQKLQSLLLYLSEDKSLEELKAFQELTEKQEELTEPWMQHLYTMIMLIREIELTAEKTQQAVDLDPNSITTD